MHGPSLKWGKALNRHFFRQGKQRADKHVKDGPLVLRELSPHTCWAAATMASLMYQLEGPRHLVTHYSACICERVSGWDEHLNRRLSPKDCILWHEWASSNELKAQLDQKEWLRGAPPAWRPPPESQSPPDLWLRLEPRLFLGLAPASLEWVFGHSVTSDSLRPHGFPSVHGILQARILEWVVISSSRGSSQPKDQTLDSCMAGRFFASWATTEAC